MKGNDNDSSSGFQKADCFREELLQPLQFFVYCNPQRLKGSGRRMNSLMTSKPKNPADNLHQLRAARYGSLGPFLNNGGCKP